MGLNSNGNFIHRISMMTDDELDTLDLQVYLVSKANQSDALYFAKKEILDPDLRIWLKKRIKKELNNIKIDSAEGKKFYTAEYNHELTKADYIAKLVIEDDEDLKDKLAKLFQALNHNNSTFLDKDAKFQVVKISKDTEHAYFIFYRGVKISAMERRNVSKLPTVRDREQLVIQDKNVIEFGGKIELFIHEEIMYILNPRTLEYTFNYDDHIKRQRDNNLETITNMSFFDEESNTTKFKETSSQYILSRGLASIKKETLDALEESFEERCEELNMIKSDIPENEPDREEYLERYSSLWPLYEHIDVENQKVRFNPDHEVTPLLHFFSDKIVESFLTKKFKSQIY
ncbi:DUF4868 domain-containing protein [Fictibacillus phosphorivorans]|nr:DUF4868 domain-containing protein [Fictibacillus phosphorivorans]MCM3775741.1 DUF4868 domain-containing protein [Fictibacillus phosphorivorans]